MNFDEFLATLFTALHRMSDEVLTSVPTRTDVHRSVSALYINRAFLCGSLRKSTIVLFLLVFDLPHGIKINFKYVFLEMTFLTRLKCLLQWPHTLFQNLRKKSSQVSAINLFIRQMNAHCSYIIFNPVKKCNLLLYRFLIALMLTTWWSKFAHCLPLLVMTVTSVFSIWLWPCMFTKQNEIRHDSWKILIYWNFIFYLTVIHKIYLKDHTIQFTCKMCIWRPIY